MSALARAWITLAGAVIALVRAGIAPGRATTALGRAMIAFSRGAVALMGASLASPGAPLALRSPAIHGRLLPEAGPAAERDAACPAYQAGPVSRPRQADAVEIALAKP